MLLSKNILIPIDFSECSLNALGYAADIARNNNAKLTILNVAEVDNFEDELHGNLSKEHLIELLNKDEILKDISHQFITRKGNVVKTIIRMQTKHKSDLIVMGTQGANNINRKLFGTNTTGIIEKSSCPVLVVPSESKYKKIKKVVLATDQHKANLEKMEEAIEMIRTFNPDLMLLYVNSDADPSVETEYLLSEIPKGIRKHITYANTTMYVSSHKNINEGIEHFIKKKKADLLIMITHPRSLFKAVFDKSKTKKMAFDTPVPLLAVPNS